MGTWEGHLALIEASLESSLFLGVRKLGGKCLKMNIKHWPDRQVLLPGGYVCFVEVKAPGEVPRKGQLGRHKKIRELGFPVLVIDNRLTLTQTLNEWQTLITSDLSIGIRNEP